MLIKMRLERKRTLRKLMVDILYLIDLRGISPCNFNGIGLKLKEIWMTIILN
jgi:hypothetical protein